MDPVLFNLNQPEMGKSRGNTECVCVNTCHANTQGSPRSPGKLLPAVTMVTKSTADASTSPELPLQDMVTVNKDKHSRNDNVTIFDFPTVNMSPSCAVLKPVTDKVIHIPMDTLPEEDEELVPIYV